MLRHVGARNRSSWFGADNNARFIKSSGLDSSPTGCANSFAPEFAQNIIPGVFTRALAKRAYTWRENAQVLIG